MDESDDKSSEEETSCHEDEGTVYIDSDSSDIKDMLQSEDVELPLGHVQSLAESWHLLSLEV